MYPSFCFSVTGFEDQNSTKLGLKECLEHDLLVPYPVLCEKQGEYVAHFKMTVMITKGKTTLLTGLPIDEELLKTEHSIKDQELIDLMAVSLDKPKKKI